MKARREIKVFKDKISLSKFAADKVTEIARKSVETRNIFHLVLSGGGTPTTLYEMLTKAPYLTNFPWNRSHFYWGDERSVAPGGEGSNFGQASKILLSKVPVPRYNIHRIKGELTPEQAVDDYQVQLLAHAEQGMNWPVFDVVLLGMGADGHTASLFPGQSSSDDLKQAIIPVTADYAGRPAQRLSLTPAVINSARYVIFLVMGADKSVSVASSIEGDHDPLNKPSQRIQPVSGRILWLLDEAAAGNLSGL